MKIATLQQLLEDRQHKNDAALVTRLKDGEQCLVYENESSGELLLDIEQLQQVRALLHNRQSAVLGEGGKRLFVRSYLAPARMFIVGAVHIAQALAPMATVAGFDVTVIDPRSAFCQAERFPGVTLINEWPDEALASADIDNQTAIVTLSHDPKIDDPALTIALSSPAFYIGSLGSKRTHAKRVDRLTEQALDDVLHRIHAPVGLDLGGRAHAEIAVSILAQIIQVRYQGNEVQGRQSEGAKL